eukprot:2605-Heterococcus_DN1.PRE.2
MHTARTDCKAVRSVALQHQQQQPYLGTLYNTSGEGGGTHHHKGRACACWMPVCSAHAAAAGQRLVVC